MLAAMAGIVPAATASAAAIKILLVISGPSSLLPFRPSQ
jgi:hypothetical protein